MKIILLGGTGMLGQAFCRKCCDKGIEYVTVARTNADYNIDINNHEAIKRCIDEVNPKIIINMAAIVDVAYCEKNPGEAYMVNSRAAGIVAEICKMKGIYYVYISTDHYYIGDKKKKHKETDDVAICNEYARTKYMGECLTGLNKDAMIVRTNIVGYRHNPDKLTFFEWAIETIKRRERMTLYDDFYTSSIDVDSAAGIVLDLVELRFSGIVNVASAEVCSKKEFILEIARQMNVEITYKTGSVNADNAVVRANSLGLDIDKVVKLVGYKMPSSRKVIRNLLAK